LTMYEKNLKDLLLPPRKVSILSYVEKKSRRARWGGKKTIMREDQVKNYKTEEFINMKRKQKGG